MKVYLNAGAIYARVEFTGGWPGQPELADLAQSLAATVYRCPVLPAGARAQVHAGDGRASTRRSGRRPARARSWLARTVPTGRTR